MYPIDDIKGELGMKRINPYLTFAGNCREAINFYKDALHGEIVSSQTFAEAKYQMDTEYADKIIHAEVKAEDITFYASDGMPGFVANGGNMVTLSINLDDLAEEERIFNALSAGGTVTMALNDNFWGARFGMLVDKFGVPWMLNCEPKKQ